MTNKPANGWSNADYPLIPEASVSEWSRETDVLVIGIRAAGTTASIEVREAGAEVLILERASGISGTTCVAGGVVYPGGGTRPQLANQFRDTPDEMYNYLIAIALEPDEEKIRMYCDESVEHLEWLIAHDVPFNLGYWKTKHHEPPSTDCLSWSGNEKAWPISESAAPSPRGHKVEHEGGKAGGLLVRRLASKGEGLGIEAEYDANVRKAAEWLKPIAKALFAALECSLNKSYYVGFTLGGLAVSAEGEVLKKDGNSVAGLYAAKPAQME